jgi:hypothetical protein
MPLATGPELLPGDVVERRPAEGVMWEFVGRRIEGVRFRGIHDGHEWLQFRDCTLVDCIFEDCDWNTVHLDATDLIDNVFAGRVEGLTL